MKRKEFTELVNKAKVSEVPERDYYFDNYRDFIEARRHDKRVRWYMSEDAAICIVRYQAMYMNGDWDVEELANLQMLFKNIDIVG